MADLYYGAPPSSRWRQMPSPPPPPQSQNPYSSYYTPPPAAQTFPQSSWPQQEEDWSRPWERPADFVSPWEQEEKQQLPLQQQWRMITAPSAPPSPPPSSSSQTMWQPPWSSSSPSSSSSSAPTMASTTTIVPPTTAANDDEKAKIVTFTVWNQDDAVAFLPASSSSSMAATKHPILYYVHPIYRLPLEDLVNTHNRAWLESFASQGFIVLCSLRLRSSGLRALPERGYDKETFQEPGEHALATLSLVCQQQQQGGASGSSAVINEVVRRIDCSNVGIIGYSVGGAEAVRVADKMEDAYTKWALSSSSSRRQFATPKPPRVRGVVSVAPTIGIRLPYGTGAREELLDGRKNKRTPILLVAGADDKRGGLEGASDLYASSKSPRVMQTLAKATHCFISLLGAECEGGACGDCAARTYGGIPSCERVCSDAIRSQQAISHSLASAWFALLLKRDGAYARYVWSKKGSLEVSQAAVRSAKVLSAPTLTTVLDPGFSISLVRVETTGQGVSAFSDGAGGAILVDFDDAASKIDTTTDDDGAPVSLRLLFRIDGEKGKTKGGSFLVRQHHRDNNNRHAASPQLVDGWRSTTKAEREEVASSTARLTVRAERRRVFRVQAEVSAVEFDVSSSQGDELGGGESSSLPGYEVVVDLDGDALMGLLGSPRGEATLKLAAMDAATAAVEDCSTTVRVRDSTIISASGGEILFAGIMEEGK
eukprot:CAMPEP_0119191652 /NCGR_PEP_ID=MMETSP1316-20130426/2390_1 /TAXON_ID=41880 /ORGANISM="Pycnococcus provasolii, Strain RCC2336" /LENGTH=709 /DNA_ID=CAMNT_0007186709 /DNA_START=174 /DNA_END=2303 /DNA_ORIENTATION=-